MSQNRVALVTGAALSPDGTVLYAIDNVVDTTFLWALGVTDRLEGRLLAVDGATELAT